MSELISSSHCAADALSFISANKKQILIKSRGYWWLDFEDYCNEVVRFILEKGKYFDPARGSFVGYVFGNLERKLRRCHDDALAFSCSLDDDSPQGRLLQAQVETEVQPSAEKLPRCLSPLETIPGASDLAMIADALSGFSCQDIAVRMKLSPRRVHQIIAHAKLQALHQTSLFSFEETEL